MKKRIFATLLALLLLLSLAGCSAKSEAGVDRYYANGTESSDAFLSDSIGGIVAPGTPAPSPSEDAADKAESNTTSPSEVGGDMVTEVEKIIYSANVTLETLSFDETVSDLEAAVFSIGGFIQTSNISGDTGYDADGKVEILNRKAYYTVRIPAEKFNDFLTYSGTLGNVISSNKSAENVTSQYTDYEARLVSLRTQEERLLSMLEKATDVYALVELESRLSEVRYQIESYQRNLQNMDSRIAYSTVSFTVREVRVYRSHVSVQRTFLQRLGDSLKGGWEDFVTGLEDFAIGFVGAIVPLCLIAVFAATGIVLLRRAVKKNRKKKEIQNEE